MACIFCDIAEGRGRADIVHEDELVVAFRDLHPVAPRHVLIIPRRHIVHLQELQPEDQALMGHLLVTVPRVADITGLAARGYRLVCNCKEEACQSVWHLHFHLLGGRGFGWPPG